ncbi:DNA-binding transcriptional regulator YbjK [Microbacterium sp. BE35]|uniref:TetR/AcrR family transcriptional regulator n=1 Tax=Microbacterium sp. BE35 TaxID=2817773 RepID=UPI0028619AC8|nr:TetR family transcriptional regulator [Microbacterium sp. BE35]MDR7187391.1 DNA-binding transcriptional regulator YbjK [Microbacterium sp. BE35]
MVARGANDPDRRERIVAAALEVIGERGVHQTSHRVIAARAGVPLGSLTYYFDGLSDILEQAFASLAARMAQQYRASLESAQSRDEACAAVVDLICGSYATTDEVRALFEMYSFGNYDAKVHDLCRDWLLVSRASLGLHFTEPTARALDALVEAFPMHQAWEGEPLDRDYVAAVVQALVDRFEPARDVV